MMADDGNMMSHKKKRRALHASCFSRTLTPPSAAAVTLILTAGAEDGL